MGIDLSASERRDSGVCLMDGLKVQTFRVKRDDEIIALARKFRPKLVAIDAPLSLPLSSEGLRQCDRELLRRGIRVFPLNFGAMKQLTERGMRLKALLEPEGFKVIEVFPGGAQGVLGLPRKRNNLAGLREGLKRLGLSGIKPDATHDEIDAVTAAYVGWLYLNGLAELLSDGQGGGIVMPLPYPPKFVSGILLYRRGFYWHAHEAWEEVWRESSEPYRSFLKGLIQTAAALIQCDRGKWEGALNLLERVQRYLSRCPPKLWGVDVANLLEQVRAFREEVAKLVEGQKTRFNWRVKPRITLEGATVPFRERLRRSKTDLPERRKG
jgi:predicted nuclease with RNAse H fold/predicted metal-dependent hydrolase